MDFQKEVEIITNKHSIKVNSVSKAEDGISNEVFIINDEFVLRFNKEKGFVQEAKLLQELHQKGMFVPKVIVYDSNYLLLEKVEGQTLNNIEELTENTYNKLGQTLRKLHSITIEEDSNSFERYIRKETKKVLVSNVSAEIKEFVSNIKFDFSRKHLIHCDPARSNIILTPNNSICLIDFEWSEYGDPLYDIAVFEIKHDSAFHKAFRRGYGNYSFDEKIILAYKILHEHNVLCWAQKRKKEKIISFQEKSLKRLETQIKVME